MFRQFYRYCSLVLARAHDSLHLVADLKEAPASDTANDDKAEKLFLMQPLGIHKPSEIMATILEVCLRRKEKITLFARLFLR